MGKEILLLLMIKLYLVNGNCSQPNIIFILADDLGFNDVSFRGSSQIMTPNIDALAYSGLILDRYYVTPICTPSRSALMTGKLPIHTGMQHTVLYGAETRGLPLSEKLLPEYLRDLGYSNHIVGKWHLGHYKKEFTPLHRGFLSHTGFWTGHHDYFDHTAVERPGWGLDIRRNMDIAYDLHGKYSTDLITDEAVKVIEGHSQTKPLFLYVAHAAVHSGNPYNPLAAPDDSVAKLDHIKDFNRRKFGAILSKLDESVGAIVKSLSVKGMLENSIIVFSTDNGGPAAGFNLNAASNWPLRGVKNTLWEGGVRGAGLIWSPLIHKKQRVARQNFHISDWLPTLYAAAGGNLEDLAGYQIDGLNLWNELSDDLPPKRREILHNIDDIWGSAAVTVGEWKVVKGTNYGGTWDYWYGPSGNRNSSSYNLKQIETSNVGISLKKLDMLPSHDKIMEMRTTANVDCSYTPNFEISSTIQCEPLFAPCLFNIIDDPCEQFNLAAYYPAILNEVLNTLNRYNQTAVPPGNTPLDPRGDPKNWNYVWTNFGDYINEENFTLNMTE